MQHELLPAKHSAAREASPRAAGAAGNPTDHHHKTHAARIPTPTSFQIPSAALLVFLCLAVVAGDPGGYHGDGVINPAHTGAGAGHPGRSNKTQAKRTPTPIPFHNPSAALLDSWTLPRALVLS